MGIIAKRISITDSIKGKLVGKGFESLLSNLVKTKTGIDLQLTKKIPTDGTTLKVLTHDSDFVGGEMGMFGACMKSVSIEIYAGVDPKGALDAVFVYKWETVNGRSNGVEINYTINTDGTFVTQ